MTSDTSRLLHDVRTGLTGAGVKTLPSKYFYDKRGSELFDQITRLPEYYPTRAERALLQRNATSIIAEAAPRTLIELGAGNADKTRLLLDAMVAFANGGDTTYIPVDVSAAFLEDSAERIRSTYPGLRVVTVVADFSTAFALPPHPLPALHAFLGSTIGNFPPQEARSLIRSIRSRMGEEDHFLLGVDLRKDVAILERAYNDSSGVTAAFNRNVLYVINQALGADFHSEAFEHRAVYNGVEHRIEMYLTSREAQTVHIPGVGDIPFARGEPILTEVSYKYDRATVTQLLSDSGLRMSRWLMDDEGLFAIAIAHTAE